MENKQDYKINDQYSICLDNYFQLDELHNMYPDIVKGLVQSKQYLEPIEVGNQRAIFNKDHIDPNVYIKDVFSKTDEYADLIKSGFSERQILEYVLYRCPVKSLGTKLLLRTYSEYSKTFATKHIARLNKDQPAYDYFPKLRNWIESSKAFDSVGRILFFINELGSYTPTHCDYAGLESFKDQFIWINLYQKKSFFVLDKDWKKQYLTGEINTFDNATWHGSDPAKCHCFTIRIDGVFTDEFLTNTGLATHYANTKKTYQR